MSISNLSNNNPINKSSKNSQQNCISICNVGEKFSMLDCEINFNEMT